MTDRFYFEPRRDEFFVLERVGELGAAIVRAACSVKEDAEIVTAALNHYHSNDG